MQGKQTVLASVFVLGEGEGGGWLFADFLDWAYNVLMGLEFESFLCCCWKVWQMCNSYIHGKLQAYVEEATNQIRDLYAQFKECNVKIKDDWVP